MLIITALNITGGSGHRKDGTADYDVEVAINHAPQIYHGTVKNHDRKAGAAKLLRLIADEMEKSGC